MKQRSLTAKQIARRLKLQLHPEGGFYLETYRCAKKISASVVGRSSRKKISLSTAIYFLLPKGQCSHLHQIRSDELWHFHLGGPLILIVLRGSQRQRIVLGTDIQRGQKLQYIVPAGSWFGAYPAMGTDFALVSCTVAPGFEFEDFRLGKRGSLLKKFPFAKKDILQLTPSQSIELAKSYEEMPPKRWSCLGKVN